jgi:ribosomal protein S18 acetylase RimI-like enzyme
MQFQDVTSRASEAEFLKLLAVAVGHPTPDKLADIVKAYGSSTRRLFALITEDGVAGIVGVELPIAGRSRIRHIAVPARLRGRGIGRRLLTEVSTAVGATKLGTPSIDSWRRSAPTRPRIPTKRRVTEC